ncbi:MAG: mechanosensitive ion channel family protein [Defluviitaleaceae bacterium]|nr:mechanosensitive ion channel family protein [Defluviitaleaceae bacterium]
MISHFLTSEVLGWAALRTTVIIFITIVIVRIFRAICRKFIKDTIHLKFIKNVLSIIIWMVGVIFALSHLPYFSDVAMALLAGSGIAALTIGLAAQESLGNAFNGLFISIFRPFEVGDRIHLINANITGFVEDITIRHTVIRTFMNSRIIIPNSVMNQELIENSNFYNAQASAFIDVIITYDANVSQASEIIAQVIGNHKDFVDTRTDEQKETDPKVPVFVRALGLYGVELRASMWTATIGQSFAACSEVRKAILQDFKDAGISISHSKIIDPAIQL